MGLFINNNEHPEVFKNRAKITEPNQVISRQDYLSEFINEQQKVNKLLNQAFAELRIQTLKQEEVQSSQRNHFDHQLNDLRSRNLEHKEFEKQILVFFQKINEKNINLEASLEKEALLKHEIIHKVSQLSDHYLEITDRMEKNEETHQQLTIKINEQLDLQKEVAEKMAKQEDFQGGMLKRLDRQEALLDKLSRQLNHIRSIIFERTNYLAAKIDDGYKITSSYVYKLMTGSEEPLNFFLMNYKKEEQQTKSD
jgi:hypothetical protein